MSSHHHIQVGVIFTNDNGQYYLEEVSFYPLENIQNDWRVDKVINSTINKVDTYKGIKEELNYPTIEDGKQLVILESVFKDGFYNFNRI
ncbi:hypothetical protein V1503_19500 [Bacillus sp. SCS-151]|uniref:hypothetical protein n=1 Tax=Nanhaiella sioensis TaxID=3115293 RepID=UPI00397C37F1